MKTQIYSFTSSSLSEDVYLIFSFSKYRSFIAKHASILSNHFLNGSFKFLWNVHKYRLGFLDHLGICFEVQLRNSHFNNGNNQNLHSTRSNLYSGCSITSMLWGSSHSSTRAALCGQALCWWWNHHWRNSGHFCQVWSRSLSSTIL